MAKKKKKAVAKKKAASKSPKKKSAAKKKPAAKKTAKKAKKKPTAKKAAKKTAAKSGKKTSKKAASKIDAIKAAAKKAAAKKKAVAKGTGKKDAGKKAGRRGMGMRGAAPWVARHAAKQAEELRKRNETPPAEGSARATLRTPEGAESIKEQVVELHNITSKIKKLRKKLDANFYEIGLLLTEVQLSELFVAKGFGSFEAFLDREVDLPRVRSLRLVRIVATFQREVADDYGLQKLTAALAALDGESTGAGPSRPSTAMSSRAMLSKPSLWFEDS